MTDKQPIKLVPGRTYVGYRIRKDRWEQFEYSESCACSHVDRDDEGPQYVGPTVRAEPGIYFLPASVRELPERISGFVVYNRERHRIAGDLLRGKGEMRYMGVAALRGLAGTCDVGELKQVYLHADKIDWDAYAREHEWGSSIQEIEKDTDMSNTKANLVGDLVVIEEVRPGSNASYRVGQIGRLQGHLDREMAVGAAIASSKILALEGNDCGFYGKVSTLNPHERVIGYRNSEGKFEYGTFHSVAMEGQVMSGYRGPHGTVLVGGNYMAAHLLMRLPRELGSGVKAQQPGTENIWVLDGTATWDGTGRSYRGSWQHENGNIRAAIEPEWIQWDWAIRNTVVEHPAGPDAILNMDRWVKRGRKETPNVTTKEPAPAPVAENATWKTGLDKQLAEHGALTNCQVCGVKMVERSDGAKVCSADCLAQQLRDTTTLEDRARELAQKNRVIRNQEARNNYASHRGFEDEMARKTGSQASKWHESQTGVAAGLKDQGPMVEREPEPHVWDSADAPYELYVS